MSTVVILLPTELAGNFCRLARDDLNNGPPFSLYFRSISEFASSRSRSSCLHFRQP